MPDVEVKINSMYPPGASGGIRAYASAPPQEAVPEQSQPPMQMGGM